MVDAVRRHLQADSTAPNPIVETDRELIGRHLLRATLSMTAITLHLRQDTADAEASGQHDLPAAGGRAAPPTKLTIPWTVPAAAPVKGILHVPAHNTPMKPGSREMLLTAIARARKWVKDVERGRSFAEIAYGRTSVRQKSMNLWAALFQMLVRTPRIKPTTAMTRASKG